jgi:SAM-dependent methyltransferase
MSPAGPGPAYDEAYFRDTFGRDDVRAGSVAWWSIRFYAALARRRVARSRGRRVLDVGCAHGHLLARLERSCETWGVDISEYAVARSRAVAPGSRIVQGDLEGGLPPEFGAVTFDLIIARYVLEHLKDPGLLLEAAAEALAPGGALLYSVPNTESPGRRLKGSRWFAFQDPTHVSIWPPDRWIRRTEECGLKVETVCSDGLWDVPYLPILPRVMQYPLFSLPAAIAVLSGRPILPSAWGENLIVIAGRE